MRETGFINIEVINNSKMEDRRRTRSQGLLEGVQLIQWDSLQDPVRIEREQAEACRRVREVNTVTNINEGAVENSETGR